MAKQYSWPFIKQGSTYMYQSSAPDKTGICPAVLSTSRSEDAIIPTTSSVQGTPAAPQQDAVVPLGTPQYTTPTSMRPRDEKYVMPHMVKLHVPEQCS